MMAPGNDIRDKIRHDLQDHLLVMTAVSESLVDQIGFIAGIMIDSLQNNNKILLMGNGGSAADAQHLAAELVGRFKAERKALPAIALTTDTSILTALGNDYGYESVFARQIEALGCAGDVVVGISTSGESANILKALEVANEIGCKTIGLTGKGGGRIAKVVEVSLVVPSQETARIQEAHITIGHIVCNLVEESFIEKPI